ncbi:MAG: 3',5'-nucleoside bisphosphate phosphatase [Burkholderiaceae bacterium]
MNTIPATAADPWRMNADLHSHSSWSDGVLAPAELVRRAHAAGVELFALTDHDETGGVAEAAAEAARLDMSFVPGVEISVTWAGKTLHVVGLDIDTRHPGLVAGLASIRAGRDERAREMAERLERLGVSGAYEGAIAQVRNPSLVSRTHFARHLVSSGVCSHMDEVFSRFLGEGAPAYVPHQWARLTDALGWIRDSGGVAVLAHPGRYRLDGMMRDTLIDEFRAGGGQAIEVVTGSHTRDQYRQYARVALDAGLYGSRGSDFHGPGESRVDLGDLPHLPDGVEPVWPHLSVLSAPVGA